MIYSFEGVRPIIHQRAYIHPQATIVGSVTIEAEVYIGPGAVLRGDFGSIAVRQGANVQENCVVHMFPGVQVVIEEAAHVGHGAIIHGATLGNNCLIGMNAVVMDDVHIGANSIVGALSFVKAGTEIPPRSLVVGNPAKIIREVSDEMLHWKTQGTHIYQELSQRCIADYVECQPLRPGEEQKPIKPVNFQPWNKS